MPDPPAPAGLGDADEDFEATYPGASALATACVLSLVRGGDALERLVATWVRAYNLPSPAAFVVLEILRGAGEPLPPNIIAERMFLTRGTVTVIIGTLEKHGLVRRSRHPWDKRMLLVEMTADARAVMEELVPRLHRDERRWLQGLSDKEQATLLRLLRKLQHHLHGIQAGARSSTGEE